jgi:predicted TIM-barrel fold metal-dependent hydrolase
MLGSDSPFLEGDPLPYVTEAQLAPAARDAVLGGNAARLFRIAS